MSSRSVRLPSRMSSKSFRLPTRSAFRNKTRKMRSPSNNVLFTLCKIKFFNIPINKFEEYKTTILKEFAKKESIVNKLNKNGETPLDLLCKQYNHPNNREEVMGYEDRQSLLSLIEDLQMHGAELKKCSL